MELLALNLGDHTFDINTMSRSLMMRGPTWHFISTAHPYMFAFKDYLLKSYLDKFPYFRKKGYPWIGFYFAYSQPYERDIEDV